MLADCLARWIRLVGIEEELRLKLDFEFCVRLQILADIEFVVEHET